MEDRASQLTVLTGKHHVAEFIVGEKTVRISIECFNNLSAFTDTNPRDPVVSKILLDIGGIDALSVLVVKSAEGRVGFKG